MRRIDRFDKYMKYKGLNDNKVTKDLNLSIGTIGKSRKEGRDLSNKNVELILNLYTDLNRVWLQTGEGEMLKDSQQITPTTDETNSFIFSESFFEDYKKTRDNLLRLTEENAALRSELAHLKTPTQLITTNNELSKRLSDLIDKLKTTHKEIE